MLANLFPKQFDNTYRGLWLAVWIFVPVVAVRAVQGANSILFTRDVLIKADGIPLDSLGLAGGQVVLSLFALLGLNLLVVPLLSAIALIRYRAMIPLLFLVLLFLQLGARVIIALHPIARTGDTPLGFYINLVLLMLTVIGFALSLQTRSALPARATAI